MQIIFGRWLGLCLCLLSVAAATPANGQTAAGILESAARTRQAALADIRNYTVVQEMMGLEAVAYFEREDVGGESMFVAKSARVNGQTIPGAAGSLDLDYYSSFQDFAAPARAGGQETTADEETDVTVIDDFTGVELAPPGTSQQPASSSRS